MTCSPERGWPLGGALRFRAFAGAAAALLLMPSAARASKVCPAGPPTCDYSSIQDAVDNASNGETILVETGIYNETVTHAARSNITVRSTRPWDPTSVVVDGGDSSAVFTINTGWTLEGLTIQNGNGFNGGGIESSSGTGGTRTIRNCVILNNSATNTGGGIKTGSGSERRFIIVNSKILGNSVVNASGTHSGGGISSSASLVLINSQVENNSVVVGGGSVGTAYGGGIAMGGGSLQMTGSAVLGNQVQALSVHGAGIDALSIAPVTLGGTLIQGNTAAAGGGSSAGGGLYLGGVGNLVGSPISNNTASRSGGSSARGGGLWTAGPLQSSAGTSITGNQADDEGGGLYCSQSLAEAQASSYPSTISGNSLPEVSNCLVPCVAGATRSCATGVPGECSTGLQTCSDTGYWGSCIPPMPPAESESGAACSDGLDNDCDGTTDASDLDCQPPGPSTAAEVPQSGHDQDPVNTFTGELFELLPPDLDLGGPLRLGFARYYASGMAAAGIAGRMGTNWRHGFEWTLVDGGATVDVTDPRGRRLHFDLVSGAFVLAAGVDVPYQLIEPTAGDFYLGDPRDGRIYFFDNGRLASIDDGHALALTLTYSGADLTQVADGLGRVLTLTYEAGGHVETVSDGTRTATFGYTGDDLTSVVDVRGKTTTYAYDPGGLMTSWLLPRGNTPYTQVYDGSGRVASQTDAESHTHTFAYDPGAGTTTITDPLSQTMVHSHTLRGDLLAVQDEAGDVYTLGYDRDRRRDAVNDRLGATTAYTYHPESGKLASVTQADGGITSFGFTLRTPHGLLFWSVSRVDYPDSTFETFDWTNSGDLVRRVDRGGFEWLYEYDELGLLLAATNPKSGTTAFTYNADGTLASRTDPAGNTTTYAYDALRRLVTITHADLSTRTFTWDPANRPLTVTDERGKTITFTYDDNGNVATVTDPLTHVTTFAYDGLDRLVGITDPLSHTASLTYDELGRVATATDRSGRTTTYGYDVRGRLASVTDPATEVWSYAFDDEGILASITDPLSHTTSFGSDDLGRTTAVTTPLSHVSGVTLDEMGRVTVVTDPTGKTTSFDYDDRGSVALIDEEGLTLGFGRDELGVVTTTTDGNGESWLQGRDAQGRVVSRTDPLARSETIAYDDRSRPALVTFPGGLGTLDVTFDDASNLTQLDYSDGTTIVLGYDDLNRLTSGTGLSLGYDDAGRLIESNGLTMSYDDAGRLAGLTLAPGKTVDYAYDARGQLQSVSDWTLATTTFAYDDAGRLVTISRPNGVGTTYTWDDDNRMVGITEGTSSAISLTRDAANRITKAVRNVPSPLDASAVTGAGFTYDAASQISTAGYLYDALGRMTADPTTSFDWSLASQLESYTQGGNTVAFTYDALSMSLSRTEAGVTRSWVRNYGLGLPLPSVEREDGIDLRYYVHTPSGALLYRIEASDDSRFDYHFDETGSTIMLTDEVGAVVASYGYGRYGELLATSGSVDNRITWRGQLGAISEPSGTLYALGESTYHPETRRTLEPALPSGSLRTVLSADNPTHTQQEHVVNLVLDDQTGAWVDEKFLREHRGTPNALIRLTPDPPLPPGVRWSLRHGGEFPSGTLPPGYQLDYRDGTQKIIVPSGESFPFDDPRLLDLPARVLANLGLERGDPSEPRFPPSETPLGLGVPVSSHEAVVGKSPGEEWSSRDPWGTVKVNLPDGEVVVLGPEEPDALAEQGKPKMTQEDVNAWEFLIALFPVHLGGPLTPDGGDEITPVLSFLVTIP